jgi:hypothetical protein
MTCTYAAINRKKLIDLDFKYDRYNFDGFPCFSVCCGCVRTGNDVKQLSLSYYMMVIPSVTTTEPCSIL